MCSANSNTLPPSYLGGVGASTKCQCGRFFSRDFLREQAQHGRRHAILRQCLEGPILGLRIRREEVFVFPVAFLFEVFERNEADRRGVNTIADSGRGGAIVEDVAQVGIAFHGARFDAFHTVRCVFFSSVLAGVIGLKKLGQAVPESRLLPNLLWLRSVCLRACDYSPTAHRPLKSDGIGLHGSTHIPLSQSRLLLFGYLSTHRHSFSWLVSPFLSQRPYPASA